MVQLVVAFIIFITTMAFAAPPEVDAANTKVKYQSAKDLNFEQLIIEGQLKRPELGIVTGNEDQNDQGLVRLRENFMDRLAADAGEELQ